MPVMRVSALHRDIIVKPMLPYCQLLIQIVPVEEPATTARAVAGQQQDQGSAYFRYRVMRVSSEGLPRRRAKPIHSAVPLLT
ncbi:hypothetical protein GCM10010082_16430 [Kushneria pakistanensis]|uniref:Uncharacterized protein n=1 Tax=Kushneria pakistanensis TaxID=1508770 RepID=A0ABQ3FHN2_9GAMM|nr:hypothetical protein GCM10010082_16430 [Kushneria pakistanensis]